MRAARAEGTDLVSTRLVNSLVIQGYRTGRYPQFIRDAYSVNGDATSEGAQIERRKKTRRTAAKDSELPQPLLPQHKVAKSRAAAKDSELPLPLLPQHKVAKSRATAKDSELPLPLLPQHQVAKSRAAAKDSELPLPLLPQHRIMLRRRKADCVAAEGPALTRASQLKAPRSTLPVPPARAQAWAPGLRTQWVGVGLAAAIMALILVGQTERWNTYGTDLNVAASFETTLDLDAPLTLMAAADSQLTDLFASYDNRGPQLQEPSALSEPGEMEGSPTGAPRPASVGTAWRNSNELYNIRTAPNADEITSLRGLHAPRVDEPVSLLAAVNLAEPEALVNETVVPAAPPLPRHDARIIKSLGFVVAESVPDYDGRATNHQEWQLDLHPGLDAGPDPDAPSVDVAVTTTAELALHGVQGLSATASGKLADLDGLTAVETDNAAAELVSNEVADSARAALELMFSHNLRLDGLRFEQRLSIEACEAIVTTTVYGEQLGWADREVSRFNVVDYQPLVTFESLHAQDLSTVRKPLLRGENALAAKELWHAYVSGHCP